MLYSARRGKQKTRTSRVRDACRSAGLTPDEVRAFGRWCHAERVRTENMSYKQIVSLATVWRRDVHAL